jgi:predicted PurR-regulated permease PerM
VVIAVVTFIWLLATKVPYALALAVLVGLLDLIPTVGSIVAGALVALAAWAVSWPIAVATLGFYVVYKIFEDCLLWPRVASRAVQVPAWLTIVAVLVGGALLGVLVPSSPSPSPPPRSSSSARWSTPARTPAETGSRRPGRGGPP